MKILTFNAQRYFSLAHVVYRGVRLTDDKVLIAFDIPKHEESMDAVGLRLSLSRQDPENESMEIDLEHHASLTGLIANVAFDLASFIEVSERNGTPAEYVADALRQFLNEEARVVFERAEDDVVVSVVIGHERASATGPLGELARYLVAA